MNETIGNIIRKYRKKSGMTQSKLGEKLNMSQANISDIERGKTKITINTFLRLKVILNISFSAIE